MKPMVDGWNPSMAPRRRSACLAARCRRAGSRRSEERDQGTDGGHEPVQERRRSRFVYRPIWRRARCSSGRGSWSNCVFPGRCLPLALKVPRAGGESMATLTVGTSVRAGSPGPDRGVAWMNTNAEHLLDPTIRRSGGSPHRRRRAGQAGLNSTRANIHGSLSTGSGSVRRTAIVGIGRDRNARHGSRKSRRGTQACIGVHLGSLTFQAPDFSQAAGYEEVGRFDDFPPGHALVWSQGRRFETS